MEEAALEPSGRSRLYLEAVFAQVPRVLSCQDRDPYSPSYGCFDRHRWGWKLTDYADATLQRLVEPLAVLWGRPGTPYSGEPALLEWIAAGMDFYCRCQHGDGSSDQMFPQERSWGAAAFLLASLTEAYRRIAEAVEPARAGRWLAALRRAGWFLCRHEERHGFISNHLAGGALGLARLAELTGETHFARRAGQIVDRILAHQSPEGWFCEYGGPDPGYETRGIEYLARLWQRSGEQRIADACRRAVRFLSHLLAPDGTLGGQYGNRITRLCMPGGLEILAATDPTAEAMAPAIADAYAAGRLPTLTAVDPGNVAALATSLLTAAEACARTHVSGAPATLPMATEELDVTFPEAGLRVVSRPAYAAVYAPGRGGLLYVFGRRGGRLEDNGYVAQVGRNRLASNQATTACDGGDESFPFVRMNRAQSTPASFLVLRMLCLTAFRNKWIGNWIKRAIVRRLITARHEVPLRLRRQVRFDDDGVEVRDRIEATGRVRVRRLTWAGPVHAMHMVSSKYFDTTQPTILPPGPVPLTERFHGGRLRRTFHIRPTADGLTVEERPDDYGPTRVSRRWPEAERGGV
jgi:hypothetical protein